MELHGNTHPPDLSTELPSNEQGDDRHSDGLKRKGIIVACENSDIQALKNLAESRGGFLNDELRRKAWPVLLGIQEEQVDAGEEKIVSWLELPAHRDEGQVQLDVNRAFIYYPKGNNRVTISPTCCYLLHKLTLNLLFLLDQSEADIERRKVELFRLITEVLRRNPYLCYFQGYHDVCQVFLLVLQPALHVRAVGRLSALRIRDFMLRSLGPTVTQLRLLPDILSLADPNLRAYLSGIEPFYALSGTLTMYAHNIQEYGDIARLFDVLLAREPVFSIYMFAQIVLNRRGELYETNDDDPSMLQFLLSKVPENLDLEKLITEASILFERHPPESLPCWSRISESSVLKTARTVELFTSQSVDDGERFFRRQTSELHWTELRARFMSAIWRHRHSARAFGVAVAVGILAYHLRRTPDAVELARAAILRLAWH